MRYSDNMAAVIRLLELQDRVPCINIQDRLNPVEFYSNSEFQIHKIGPNSLLWHPFSRFSLLIATCCFQMMDGELFGVYKSSLHLGPLNIT